MAGFIAAAIVALEASWLLAIVIVICFPMVFVFGYLQLALSKGRTAKNKRLMEESGKTMSEAINSICTVASLGEEKFHCRYQEQLRHPFKYRHLAA